MKGRISAIIAVIALPAGLALAACGGGSSSSSSSGSASSGSGATAAWMQGLPKLWHGLSSLGLDITNPDLAATTGNTSLAQDAATLANDPPPVDPADWHTAMLDYEQAGTTFYNEVNKDPGNEGQAASDADAILTQAETAASGWEAAQHSADPNQAVPTFLPDLNFPYGF